MSELWVGTGERLLVKGAARTRPGGFSAFIQQERGQCMQLPEGKGQNGKGRGWRGKQRAQVRQVLLPIAGPSDFTRRELGGHRRVLAEK